MIAVRGIGADHAGAASTPGSTSTAPIFNDLARPQARAAAARRRWSRPRWRRRGAGPRPARVVGRRRLQPTGDAPAAARLVGPAGPHGACGGAYLACGGARGSCRRAGRGPHRRGQPLGRVGLEFFAIAVVALGAGGLPAGRVRRRPDRRRRADPHDGLQLHDHPRRAGHLADHGDRLPAARRHGRRQAAAGPVDGRRVGRPRHSWTSPMGRVGAALARHALAGATVLLALVFAVVNPRFRDAAEPRGADRAERRARHRRGRRDDRHRVAHGRHLARLGRSRSARWWRRWRFVRRRRRRRLALAAGVLACLAVYGFNGLDRRRPRARSADRHARGLDLGARARDLADGRPDPRRSTPAS